MVSSCTRTWGHQTKLTGARHRTNGRKLVLLTAQADLCKPSPLEGMAVTGGLGKLMEKKVTQISIPEKTH